MIYIDLETYSTVPLAAGTHNYAQGAQVLLCAWAINDSPVRVWDVQSGEPMPVQLYAAINNTDEVLCAHNTPFDATLIDVCELFGSGVVIPKTRWYCTMAQALAHGLPGGLDMLCKIYQLDDDVAKMSSGKALMRWFCVPDKDGKRRMPADQPEKWKEFVAYAANDIKAMRKLHLLMPRYNFWPDNPNHIERVYWRKTWEMNDRGFKVDVPLAVAAKATAERLKDSASSQVFDLTNGEVSGVNATKVLTQYLQAHAGVPVSGLSAGVIDKLLARDDLPPDIRELLLLRSANAKSSVAKYSTILRCADYRGRMTNTIQYCGASGTGRDAGRTFQPQNMPRPPRWYPEDEAEVDALVRDARAGVLELYHPEPMACLAAMLRGAIIPDEGHKLCVSDLSNIEGRMVSWLAGEEWKVKYFSDYDAGIIRFDNYVASYSMTMGVAPETVDSFQRQVGKCQELSFGYGSGVKGNLQFLHAYRVDMDVLASATQAAARKDVWAECYRKYDWAVKNKFDCNLPKDQWTACEYNKTVWREANSLISALWAKCEGAFRMAMNVPKVWHKAGEHLAYRRQGQWLYCRLPSGRLLCYLQPKDVDGNLTYMAVDQYTKKWTRTKLYGGMLTAHATQASSRDLLFDRALAAENEGYPMVFRVHDELVAETPDTPEFDHLKLGKILSTQPHWCPDLPLAAAGFQSSLRYRKD
jgi:DNA polymerase bacteriophage-type